MYADGMTRNLPKALFTLHAAIIKSGNFPCRREDVEPDDTTDIDDVDDTSCDSTKDVSVTEHEPGDTTDCKRAANKSTNGG